MPPTRIWLQVTPMSGLLPGQFPPVVLAPVTPPPVLAPVPPPPLPPVPPPATVVPVALPPLALLVPLDPPLPTPLLSLEPEPEEPLADRLLWWWARWLASTVETNASPTMSASDSPAATSLGPPPRMMSRRPSLRSL